MLDGVSWYLAEAGKIPLLSTDEEIIYGHQVRDWQRIKDVKKPTPNQKKIIRLGKKAKDRMFKANLRLVVAISKKYLHAAICHMSFLDLIQEGNLGLARAIEKFDPERGYKFSTYSYWWIRQAITRAISNQDRSIRLPINAISIQSKVSKYADEYYQEHGKLPTVEECSEYCKIRPITMRAYLEHTQKPCSLDQLVNNGDSSTGNDPCLLDFIASDDPDPQEELEIESGLQELEALLSNLKPKERRVLELRFGIGSEGELKTFSEVGRTMGMSRERIRQIEKKALHYLRRKCFGKAFG